MQTTNLLTLESELASVNEYLKDALVNDKIVEVVTVLGKRSSIIKRIEEVRWAQKSKQERRVYLENRLIEAEKYFHKYGEAEDDVARKYTYKKYFVDLIDSIDELEGMTNEPRYSSLKFIVKAIREILDSSEFVDVNEIPTRISLDALFSCISLDANDTIDLLQEKIRIAHRKYIKLMDVGR